MPEPSLSAGSVGDQVSALHAALARAGFEAPNAEVERHHYGPGTRLAVQKFQRKQGLPVTGDVDAATAARLSLAPQETAPATERAARGAPAWTQVLGSAPDVGLPPAPTDGLAQFGSAYTAFGTGLLRSVWDINWSYVCGAARSALAAIGDQSPGIEVLSRDLLSGAASYAAEIGSVLPTNLNALSRQLDADARRRSTPQPVRLGSEPSRPDAHVVKGVPVVLPVRIVDASQAFGFYFVDAARLQRHLDAQAQPFAVAEFGAGRTPLSIMGVDYRETDLGVYYELGICALVRPHDDPTEIPGTLFLSLSVSDSFNIPRAKELWGYSKTFAPHMGFTYHRHSVHVAIDNHDPTALSVSLPRFGSARSRDIPRYTWGVKGGVPCKMLIARSGSGEGLQVGGNVTLTLGDGTQKRCVCSLGSGEGAGDRPGNGSRSACVCLLLRDLGLPRAVAANTWSETMSALCMESVLSGNRRSTSRESFV